MKKVFEIRLVLFTQRTYEPMDSSDPATMI